ncbi:minor tail protein [Gordonia phage Ronaldo]|uniref:Minor tail protein n=3 Tax=Ronaldovirus ronaldo TaxID=2734270 RepID=A0A6B9L8B0_9CAUD|nr:minor tail protein [Gordonia phage Ronaldo]AXN53619.1 hypothetical protein SEA_RONALDO_57 [Gordonia phage Ronaldo]QDH48396.1 hypothetical protein SEA_ZIKO_57 [Gordonia phage Ziko]QHB38172.1 hypothetical protein SEA_VOLT_56 [Gordonia phage Volt]
MSLREEEMPSIKNCDPTDPEEAFLPYYMGMPNQRGAGMPFPKSYLRLLSRQMWEAGCRPPGPCPHCGEDISEVQLRYQKPPMLDREHWATNPGMWVPIDTPEPEFTPVDEIVDAMPPLVREAVDASLDRYRK